MKLTENNNYILLVLIKYKILCKSNGNFVYTMRINILTMLECYYV